MTQPAEPDPGQRAPLVRVVIVSFNSGHLLKACIERLRDQTFRDFEVVVVENGDLHPDFAAWLARLDSRFSLIHTGSNLGFAQGVNCAALDSATAWIATLNPDAIPSEGWLMSLIAATEKFPGVAMFGSTQINALDTSRLDGCGDAYFAFGLPWRGGSGHPVEDTPQAGETFSPCAAAALYDNRAFAKAGGFDETFFCYLEDIDLGFRMRLLGERCVQVHDAIVHHVSSADTGRNSDFTFYHSTRNGIWTFAKNMPAPLVWILLPAFTVLQLAWLVRAVGFSRFGSTCRGLWAGLVGLPQALRKRRAIQATRTASWLEIAQALSWSPLKLSRKDPDIRAL